MIAVGFACPLAPVAANACLLPSPAGKDGGIDVTRLMELADDAEEEEAGNGPKHSQNSTQ